MKKEFDGHVGVVEHVILDEKDPSKDIVIILEAIGSGGSCDESACQNLAPIFETTYEKSGKVRRSFYYRTGGALFAHPGWKGYFKVKEKD